jgi:hypothetical protein
MKLDFADDYGEWEDRGLWLVCGMVITGMAMIFFGIWLSKLK